MSTQPLYRLETHTPGPWQLGDTFIAGDRNAIYITSRSRNVIFHQWNHGDTKLTEEDYANARLIAQSPDMIALIQRIANLNPLIPEIGAGMFAQLVDEARRIVRQVG